MAKFRSKIHDTNEAPSFNTNEKPGDPYDEALNGLNRERKRANIVLIACALLFIALFGYGFFWLGSQSAPSVEVVEAPSSTESSEQLANLKAELKGKEQIRDVLTFEIETLGERLHTAEERNRVLHNMLTKAAEDEAKNQKMAVEAALAKQEAEAKKAALEAQALITEVDTEALRQKAIEEANAARDKEMSDLIAAANASYKEEWIRFQSLNNEWSKFGRDDDYLSSLTEKLQPPSARLEAPSKAETLAAIMAQRNDLAQAIAGLTLAIELAPSQATPAPAPVRTTPNPTLVSQRPATAAHQQATNAHSLTPSEVAKLLEPGALFSFLQSKEAKSWSYRKDLAKLGKTELLYEFKFDVDGDIQRVPFFSYDTWKSRLNELQQRGVEIHPDLRSFASYQRFAQCIPYFQKLGVYVERNVPFGLGKGERVL